MTSRALASAPCQDSTLQIKSVRIYSVVLGNRDPKPRKPHGLPRTLHPFEVAESRYRHDRIARRYRPFFSDHDFDRVVSALDLCLQNYDWKPGENQFRVIALKTEHQDGGERWVPLFPELRPYLEEAFERAPPGAVHVITRWRDVKKNLHTGLLRTFRRAGVKPWPRLYQNLRSFCETELAERFPIHVVAEWLGNSPKTALAHYTHATGEHYQRAAESGASALQNQVQQPTAPSRKIRRRFLYLANLSEKGRSRTI
jgi:hypothetical protein